ncbi:MAG: replication factor C large subunit [Candidatus Micrarchaeota archaeon]
MGKGNAELYTMKYAPSNLKEVAGNEEAKEEIRKWALEADRGKKVQPLLLHGAVGTGKSAAAVALAKEMGWEIIETNASDLRDAETLKKIYGLSVSSGSLYGEKRMLLIDEIDSVSDRQEFSALQQIIKESQQPVVLIANDVWNQKLSAIRFACKQIGFKKINSASIRRRLSEIAQKENVPDGEKAEAISKESSGDIRAALNDLQGTSELKEYVPGLMGRDRDENIFDAVRTVFKTMNFSHAREAGENYNTQEFDMFSKWIDENIPLEYEKPEEVAEAYHWLSRSDIFRGRIMRRQHWGFLKYVNALSTAGVALSKHETYRKFSKYQFPSSIKMMGQTKKNRGLLKSINRKVARKLHVSLKDAIDASSALSASEGFSKYFELDEDEMSLAAELYKHEKHKEGKARKK